MKTLLVDDFRAGLGVHASEPGRRTRRALAVTKQWRAAVDFTRLAAAARAKRMVDRSEGWRTDRIEARLPSGMALVGANIQSIATVNHSHGRLS